MLTGEPLFPGDSDIDQLFHITKCLGEYALNSFICEMETQNMTWKAVVGCIESLIIMSLTSLSLHKSLNSDEMNSVTRAPDNWKFSKTHVNLKLLITNEFEFFFEHK